MEWWSFIVVMVAWDIIRAFGTAYITARKVKKDREEEKHSG